jgi:hypothetical protein
LVHRDLKPDNLLIRRDGVVKVADFGIAKPTQADLTVITQADTTRGTVPYMSPEQLRAGALDARSDIWAMGCVLYYAMTARHLFVGDSAPSIMMRIIQLDFGPTRPDPFGELNDLREGAGEVLRRCVALEPDHRFDSAEQLRTALVALLPGGAAGPSLEDSLAAASSAFLPAWLEKSLNLPETIDTLPPPPLGQPAGTESLVEAEAGPEAPSAAAVEPEPSAAPRPPVAKRRPPDESDTAPPVRGILASCAVLLLIACLCGGLVFARFAQQARGTPPAWIGEAMLIDSYDVPGGTFARYRATGDGEWAASLGTVQLYDRSGLVWSVDLNSYFSRTDYIAIQDVKYRFGIVYFDDGCQIAASAVDGQCSSVYAVEGATGTLLWKTPPVFSNINMTLVGNYLAVGYGYTDEADYLRLLRLSDGGEVCKLWVEKAPISIELATRWTEDGAPILKVILYNDRQLDVVIRDFESEAPKLEIL